MARACSICCHPHRAAIDGELVRRRPHRAIARSYGVSRSAVSRHVGHMNRPSPTPLVAPQSQPAAGQPGLTRNLPDPINSSATPLDQLRYLQDHTLHLLERASSERQTTVALQAIKEARANVELMAKLTGALVDRHSIQSTVTHELADLDIPALKAKLKELESDLTAIDTEGVPSE